MCNYYKRRLFVVVWKNCWTSGDVYIEVKRWKIDRSGYECTEALVHTKIKIVGQENVL